MSESSVKGQSLEKEVASLMRKKLGVKVERDKRSGAGSHQKMDLRDWYEETPLDIEVKNHKTVKIKEWFRQAKGGASFRKMPTVVFQSDDEVLACLRFSDLLDLIAETHQGREELTLLKAPVKVGQLDKVVAKKAGDGFSTCRGGHLIAPGNTKCLMKGCPYSSGYKAKKKKD